MKKLAVVCLAGMMVLSLAGCGKKGENPIAEMPVAEEAMQGGDTKDGKEKEAVSGEKILWSVGSTTAEDHPSIQAYKKLAEALEKETDGRWTLEIYANSTMGTEQECIDMCRVGTLTICATNLTIMEQYIPDFGVFALPYLFRSWEDYSDYVDNGELAQKLFQKLEESNNLRFMAIELNGTRCLSTNKIGEIQRPEDLKGAKIRSMEAPVWQDIISALGGTPIPVNFSELYMALQTGVVNGQDNPLALLYSNKFYEVLDNVYRTDHCYNTVAYWIYPEAYDALSAEDQVLWDRLVQEYLIDDYETMMESYNKEAEDAIKESGVRIWEPEEFDIEAFYKSADDMVNEKYLTNETYKPYIEDIRATYHYE